MSRDANKQNNHSFKLYLGSASSRRQDLLSQLGYKFDVLIPEIDESIRANELAGAYVERMALEKAQYCSDLIKTQGIEERPLICADTAISLDDQIIGKPINPADAIMTLEKLSGRHHQVITVVSLAWQDRLISESVISDVYFANLDPQDIIDYCDSDEPHDKAGSYAIQGTAGRFIKQISGSYSAIVGLPLYETEQLLKKIR